MTERSPCGVSGVVEKASRTHAGVHHVAAVNPLALPDEGQRWVAGDHVAAALRPMKAGAAVLSLGVASRVAEFDEPTFAGSKHSGFGSPGQVPSASLDVAIGRYRPLCDQRELLSVRDLVDLTSQLSQKVLVDALDLAKVEHA